MFGFRSRAVPFLFHTFLFPVFCQRILLQTITERKNSAIINFICLTGLLELLRLPMDTLYLRIYLMVSLVNFFAIYLKRLFCFLKPNKGCLHLHRYLFSPHIESSTEELPNAGSKDFHTNIKNSPTLQSLHLKSIVVACEGGKMFFFFTVQILMCLTVGWGRWRG